MRGYAVRRMGRGLVTVWLVTLAVFFLLRFTGDPIDYLANPSITVEDRERMKQEFGLDKPWHIQYLLFNKGIFTGNFGVSVRWSGNEAFDVFQVPCNGHRATCRGGPRLLHDPRAAARSDIGSLP